MIFFHRSKNITEVLNITGDKYKKIYLNSLIPFKIGSILNILILKVFFFYQYQNLGVNLAKLYTVMADLTHDLQVRFGK